MDRSNTKTKIFLAAKELFYKNGYKRTSCTQISQAAGVNVALINYYYKSKLKLGVEVYNSFTRDLRDLMFKKVIETGFDYEPIVAVGIEYYIVTGLKKTDAKFEKFSTELCVENGLLDTEHYVGFNVKYLKEKYDLDFSDDEIEHAYCCFASIINGMTVIRRSGIVEPRNVASGDTLNVLLKILDFNKKQRADIISKAKLISSNIDISLSDGFVLY